MFIDRIDYNISFKKHPDIFATKAEHIKYKYGNILNRNIHIEDLFNILDIVLQYNHQYQKYNVHSKLKTAIFTYNVASILELELAISTYLGNKEWSKNVWQRINKYIVNQYPPDNLLTDGLTLGEWVENLYSVVDDKNKLMKCIEDNSIRPDVKRLTVGEFVNIDKFKPNYKFQKNWKTKISSWFTK